MHTLVRTIKILLIAASFMIPVKGLFAQLHYDWIDITMSETTGYTSYGVHQIRCKENPPENLFDGCLQSFWKVGNEEDEEWEPLYMELPGMNGWTIINIFAGHGQDEKTYHQYARPRKLHFSLYVAVNPQGHSAENSVLYQALRFPHEHTVFLANQFEVQSLRLNFSESDLEDFKSQVIKRFAKDFQDNIHKTAFILKMEIQEVFPGQVYDDLVISEIYFNDCLPSLHTHSPTIKSIYLNPEENSLWAENADGKQLPVHKDTDAVFQILDISPDNQWAVLISMPALPDGRVETTYLLANTFTQKIVNTRLEDSTGNYMPGTPMFLETGDNGKVHLLYFDNEGAEQKIWLR